MRFGMKRTRMVALAGTLGLTLAAGGGSALAQMGPAAPPGGMPDPCQRPADSSRPRTARPWARSCWAG